MTATEDVARELVLLVRALKGLHADVLTDSGLRVELAAAAVLGALAEHDRARLSGLAETLALDLSSVSRQVAGLEREGWVARERDPADSRAVLLHLTQAGREALSRLREARLAQLTRLLPTWSEAELSHLAGQLARFRTDLTADRPAGRPTDRVPAQTAAGDLS